MKKWLLIITPLVLLAMFGVWFWSLASVPDEDARSVTLTVEETGVHVRQPGLTNWEAAKSGMEIGEGWSVRTDKSGLATIEFFGQGESRMGHQTEVAITAAMVDELNPSSANIEVEVGAGRVWSRVLKLFDLDSSYSVRTSAVVATVRGTAFDVTANADGSSEIIVNESAVDVQPAGDTAEEPSAAIAEGFALSFGADGRMGEAREISDDMKRDDWYRRNTESDEAFAAREREQRLKVLRSLDGPRTDSIVSGMAKLSEQMHLALNKGNEREILAQRYLARRYLHLIDLVEQGKAGMAAQEFAKLENYIRTELRGPESEAERQRIRAALKRISFLVEDADPDSPLFAFKQRIENLTEALTESNEGSAVFVRLLALDARLDEVRRLLSHRSYDEAGMTLDGVKNGIENVIREVKPVLPRLTSDERRTIHGKISAVTAREKAMRKRLEAALAPVEETATSTEDGIEDRANGDDPSTEPAPVVTPPDEPPTVEPPVDHRAFESISVSTQPNPLKVGETANLTVIARRADGSEMNVSTLSTFEIQHPIGTLNGPRITATRAGNTMITAHYEDDGYTHSASVSINVESEVVLESLRITSSAGTSLSPGQGTNLIAEAVYSNAYSKVVTAQTSFVLASGIGSVSDATYDPGKDQAGEAMITGTFTENGATVEGAVSLTIGR